MKQLILASQSPRRRALLEMIGLYPQIVLPSYEEVMPQTGSADEITTTFAREKVASVPLPEMAAVILAADTIVSVDHRVYGKPRSRDEAITMLQTMSGRSHLVVTGYALFNTETQDIAVEHVSTTVHMRRYTQQDIETHLETTSYLDKAGAYAVQDRGALLVDRIDGDFYNIVGLPISAVYQKLLRHGVVGV